MQFAGCEAEIELPRHDSDQSVLIEYNISSAAKLQAFFDFCTFFCINILLKSEDFDLWMIVIYTKQLYFYHYTLIMIFLLLMIHINT